MASLACSTVPDRPDLPELRPVVVDPGPGRQADTIEELVRASQHRGLARSLAIARVLTDRLYDGDPTAFRRRAQKSVSLRRLVQLGAPISAAALYRAQSIYEIWTRVGGRRWPNLTASHYRAVEAVPPDGQHAWLALAAQREWSAAQLRGAIVAGCGEVVSRGGRLPKHPVARFAARVERELARLAPVTRKLHVGPRDRVRMAELATRLEAIAASCTDYARRIRAMIRNEQ